MQPVPRAVADQFASSFSSGSTGLSLVQVREFFGGYQNEVPAIDRSMTPTKPEYFCRCLYGLAPENQRQALYDLCDDPPDARGPLPGAAERKELLVALSQADGASPLGIELSSLSLRSVRNQWFTAASRLTKHPAPAVTAARTLLETTLKTIVSERGESPDKSGDLLRLYRQAQLLLGIKAAAAAGQATHQVLQGLTQTLNGLAALSNLAGDRHGLAGGKRITDYNLAALAVHAAGTVSLFLVKIHRAGLRTGSNP